MGAAGHYHVETGDDVNAAHSKLSDGEKSQPEDAIGALPYSSLLSSPPFSLELPLLVGFHLYKIPFYLN